MVIDNTVQSSGGAQVSDSSRKTPRVLKRRRAKPLLIFCSFIFVPVLAIIFLWWYNWSDEEYMVPLIKAAKGPYKVRPEIPGGMKILNKDMDIYNVLENRPEKPSKERLAAAPQDITSLTKPKLNIENKKEVGPSLGKLEEILNKKDTLEKISKNKVEITNKEKKDNLSKSGKTSDLGLKNNFLTVQKNISSVEKKSDKGIDLVTNKEVIKLDNVGNQIFRVQLLSVRKKESAETEWKRLSKRHSKILSGLESYVVRADLGARGIYYRLQAGLFKDKDTARKICTKLAQVKISCFVIKQDN